MAITVLTSNETGANSLIDINANFADLDTTKADLASPTFTGTPTLPTGTIATTQSASDNSTKIATTAYVDTAAPSLTDRVLSATVSMTTAQIKGAYATPVEIVAAPGAGKAVIVDQAVFSFTYIAPQYTGGGDFRLQYQTSTDNILGVVGDGGGWLGTSDILAQINPASATRVTVIANKAIQFTNATGAFATGNGTVKVFIKYRIITL